MAVSQLVTQFNWFLPTLRDSGESIMNKNWFAVLSVTHCLGLSEGCPSLPQPGLESLCSCSVAAFHLSQQSPSGIPVLEDVDSEKD